MTKVENVDTPEYVVARKGKATDDEIISKAIAILEKRVRRGPLIATQGDVTNYLRLEMGTLEYEVFKVLFLDSQHRILADETMFRGTVNQTSVYPREVVMAALKHNASAVILVHNHPSGGTEPSRADEALTQAMKAALALVDVRVLDHIVVSCAGYTSFAERGLL